MSTNPVQDNRSEWNEEQIKQAQAPFQEQCFDQFIQTLAARGYPVKTAEEAGRMWETANRLQEKIASGQMRPPRHEPSAFDSVQEKLAEIAGGGQPQLTREEQLQRALLQDMTEKVAAASVDPYIMYQATALATME